MVFSNTTTQEGLVQSVEFWSRLPYGSSGNTLKEITARINRAFDKIMPILLSKTDQIRWDDFNHTDAPIGYVNIVSGQADYKITEDDNNLDILNLSRIRILLTSTGTEYQELERMTVDDERALDAMSPNPSVTGIPTHFLESGTFLYLYPEPNFSATNGIELFFEREQSYFASTDTTKEPGIPKPYHELLALYAALDWVSVNKSEDISLQRTIKEQIAVLRDGLDTMISSRHPTKSNITTKQREFR